VDGPAQGRDRRSHAVRRRAGLPVGGDWFIYDYVFIELAHRQRDESLLWDDWGAMAGDIEHADLGLADEIAGLLLEADAGSTQAESDLASALFRRSASASERLDSFALTDR
jgi:hypothetical protein